MRKLATDVLVLGAGVAGLTVARGLAGHRSVLVVAAGPGSTPYAQGGIAAAVDPADSPEDHASDTLAAGAGLCATEALSVLCQEGPAAVAGLLRAGARLDRVADRLALGLEGGHHRRRIVHAGGDATGAEVDRALSAVPVGRLERLDGAAVALTTGRDGQVTGARVRTSDGDAVVHARATVLATGGLGHAYARTTNPAGVDGSGLALALTAGAALTDLEFVQFHPTALAAPDASGRLPLVSEAVRGEGALLLDHDHRRFMVGRHELAELAPRDVVAREIHRVAAEAGHVWLDARRVPDLAGRFPTFLASCRSLALDPRHDLVPVTPAEHYLCGGVATDCWGATTVPGLYAVGEVAATGVHGANRLASNSLLEGLVFGRRLADRLLLDLPERVGTEVLPDAPHPVADRQQVRELLSQHAGVVRDAPGLSLAAAALDRLPRTDPHAQVARAVVAAATARTESRGTHFRRDFPEAAERWARRLTVRLGPSGVPEVAARGLEDAA